MYCGISDEAILTSVRGSRRLSQDAIQRLEELQRLLNERSLDATVHALHAYYCQKERIPRPLKELVREYTLLVERSGPDSEKAQMFLASHSYDESFTAVAHAIAAGKRVAADQQLTCQYVALAQMHGCSSPEAQAFRAQHQGNVRFAKAVSALNAWLQHNEDEY